MEKAKSRDQKKNIHIVMELLLLITLLLTIPVAILIVEIVFAYGTQYIPSDMLHVMLTK